MATPADLEAVAPGEGPLDELLAALLKDGEVDSKGAFTMDRQKARQKMQRFQLGEPARYVLELVQAAVLRGARHISVQIEQDDLHLRCDAAPFTLQDFQQIYDALFIRSHADKRQALRHLALGASTALSMKPAWVRVEGGGSAGAHLQLYAGDKEKIGPGAQTDLGLHVHVRQRGRLGMLWRLLNYYEDPRPAEFEMLREHCGLSMVPIEINGMPVTVGYQLPGTMFWMNYQHGNTRGVIGVMATHPGSLPPGYPFGLHSTMHLLRNCVSFEIDMPPLLLPGFGTLVESPSFHLDISHQRVVRNESYAAAVGLVLAQQIQLLVRECKRLYSKERALYPEMLEGLVRALLSRLGSLDPLLRWAGRADAGPTPVPRGYPDKVPGASAILLARLWPTPQGTRVSLAEILSDLQTFGTVAVTTIEYKGGDRERPLVLLLRDATSKEIFATLFRGRLEERHDASEQAHERAKNLGRWRKRKQDPRLPPYPYLATVPINTALIKGEVGIEGSIDEAVDAAAPALRRGGELRLTLLCQGAVLVDKELAVALPGLHAVLAGDFLPTYAWDDVEPDAALSAALQAVLDALPALAEQLLALPEHGFRQENRQRALRELFLLSRSASAQAALMQQLDLPGPTAVAETAQLSLARLSGVPLFESLDGELLTIDQLREHFAEQGYLAVINPDASTVENELRTQFIHLFRGGKSLARAWQLAAPDRPFAAVQELGEKGVLPPRFVVWQGGFQNILREALRELCPPEFIWDVTGWMTAAAQHLHALVARELDLHLEEQCVIAVPLSGPHGPLGTLGLLTKARWHRREDLIEVELRSATPEPLLRLGFPRGGMLAVYLAPNAELVPPSVSADRRAVVSATLRRSLSAAAPSLIAALLATTKHHALLHRKELLAALAATLFPTAALRMNYERLRNQSARSGAAEDAETEHAAILDLVAARSAQHVDAVLQRLMQEFPQEPVRAAALYAELLGESREFGETDELSYRSGAARDLIEALFPDTAGQTFAQRALHPHPLLQSASLFQSLGGEPLTLGQVLAECLHHGDLLYVAATPGTEQPKSALPGSRLIVRITQDATGLLLYCLLGEDRLREYKPGTAEPADQASAAIESTGAVPAFAPESVASPAPPIAVPPDAARVPSEPPPKQSAAARERRIADERLLKALTTEIRAVVGSSHKLLTSINLERIHIGDSSEPLAVICTDYQTLLNRKNATMRRALSEAETDPAAMWFVVSAIYTALNVFFEGVTDADEAQFLKLLTRRATSTLARAAQKTPS